MAKRIKVFYLIERLARAGTELHLLKMLQRLDRSRFEPVICCLNGEKTEPDLLPPDVKTYLLNARWNLLHPASLNLFRHVRRAIRSENPDILHTFLFVSNVIGPYAARGMKNCRTIASRGRMGIEWQAGAMHRFLQRAADKRTDAIICKTNALREETARVENVPLEKLHVIPNGVDLDHFTIEPGAIRQRRDEIQRQHGVLSEGPLVLAIGNLKPIKGHATLIQACRSLAEQFPHVQVAIVGEGESEADLRALISFHGLAKHVHLPGRFDDVRPWMQAADLFVAPSQSEGMPNAVLEAMAMGLPLVLSEIPGHVETAGRESAWYFEPGDAEDLTRNLAEAIASPERRATRGRAGQERVQSELSLDTMVSRIESLYQEWAGHGA